MFPNDLTASAGFVVHVARHGVDLRTQSGARPSGPPKCRSEMGCRTSNEACSTHGARKRTRSRAVTRPAVRFAAADVGMITSARRGSFCGTPGRSTCP